MEITKEQYQNALDVIHEYLPMQLQVLDRHTGEWKSVGSCVRGSVAAHKLIQSSRNRSPNQTFRIIPKNEADKYREGFLQGHKVRQEEERTKFRRPFMFMPENL